MAIGGINLGQELLNIPMGEMIRSMAMAIADAQWALDKSSMTVAEMMSGRRVLRDLNTGALIGAQRVDKDGKLITTNEPQILDSRVYFGYSYELGGADGKTPVKTPQLLSMMELGFTPTFYQFVDTIIEVKISISISSQSESSSTTSNEVQTNTETNTDKSDYSSSSSYSASSSYSRDWNWSYSNSYRYGSSSTNTKQQQHQVATSQVNATYSNKYGYSAEGSSLLRTKLVPLPPPAILEERIHEIMRIEKAYDQWHMLDMMQSKITDKESKKYKELDMQKEAVINNMVGAKN